MMAALVGCNYSVGTISNSYGTASVVGTEIDDAGGLVGWNKGRISNCYATGNVTGGYGTGSLVGGNSGGTISNCYAAGNVTGGGYCTGGLVGKNYGGTISNCYAAGSVAGNENTGGLVGDNYKATISASFWDVNSSNMDTSAGGEPKTTAQMQTISTFTGAGWDFVGEQVNGREDIWRMCVDGLDYPMLWWEFIDGDFVCPDGVDLIDYSFFAEHWMDTDCGDSNACEGTDIDFSGSVDLADLLIFTNRWLMGK